MAPHIFMFLITISVISYIVYNFIKDKPVINVFIAVIIQSFLLFIIRFLWLKQSFSDAFALSFDLLTIIIVIVYCICKFNKRNKKAQWNWRNYPLLIQNILIALFQFLYLSTILRSLIILKLSIGRFDSWRYPTAGAFSLIKGSHRQIDFLGIIASSL